MRSHASHHALWHLERVFLATVASTLPTNHPEGLLPMCPRLSIWLLQGQPPTHTHTHNLQFSKIQMLRAEMVMGWWHMGENLHPPFSSPTEINETAQDFPNGQGKSEWTSYSKRHPTDVCQMEESHRAIYWSQVKREVIWKQSTGKNKNNQILF